MRLETADLGLAAVDALDVEAVALCIGPERPLQGLAGFVDWRLCGLLSHAIRDGRYQPDAGEVLLLPSAGRLTVPRVFAFGVPARPSDETGYLDVAGRICVALRRAGCATWGTALPDPAPGAGLPTAALFLSAVLPVAPRRLVLLGDARALHRELSAAREARSIPGLDIAAPRVRADAPARPPGLPHHGAPLR